MTHHHHAAPAAALTRREWLARSGLGLAGALGAGTLGNLMLATRPAYAADYKALADKIKAANVDLVYYGGNGPLCGKGAWPPELHGNVGVLYLESTDCRAVRFASADEPPRPEPRGASVRVTMRRPLSLKCSTAR